MIFSCFPRRLCAGLLLLSALLLASVTGYAAEIRGVITDASGATITGATVLLVHNGTAIGSASSASDGSFQLSTGVQGRFYLVVSANSFRQLQTPGFYAKRLDTVQRNLVLEPEWARESIVVTATGTPTPQPQLGASTSVLGPLDFGLSTDLVTALRSMPGTGVVQIGQRGAQASLFVRGGDSDNNLVLLDGVSAGDLGGRFDFGPLSTTAIESAEMYRGPDSSLYGAGAESGVVSLTTPRGTTSFPSLIFHGDAGNFNTSREDLELAGTHNKLDYLGEFSWLQTDNNLPHDQAHVATAAGNFGWQPNAATQIRGTVHYGVASVGVPNAWTFYHVADQATQKDQDLIVSASVDNQTTDAFHNSVRYGATRRRDQYFLWQPSGTLLTNYDGFGDDAYFGDTVTIKGANGYSATGRAILDYPETYPYPQYLDSNRDQLVYQGDYRFTPHLQGLIGSHFEDERGRQYLPTFSEDESTERTNYVYLAAVQGDFKGRFFYHLGGSLEHYSEFGTQTAPHAGFSVYALKPRKGIFSGTRVLFNYGDANREPALTEELSSLYKVLVNNGEQDIANELNIGPLAGPTARTYEGGGEQSFLSQRIVLRVSYFHNQFGKQVESVGGMLLPNILNLSEEEKQKLIAALGYYYTDDYGLYVSSEAFRAQGVETTLEGGIGRSIFLRGGYTYLDSVVQRSFSSDNEALAGGYGYSFNGIPLGAYSPLKGARPFRRPPHSGFLSASYSAGKITGVLSAAFTGRSDDSTYLAYEDQNGGNSLLLPNRNLDPGFVSLSLGGSYQVLSWLAIYEQVDNATDNQHAAPIGYLSLPVSVRTGLTLQWGKSH